MIAKVSFLLCFVLLPCLWADEIQYIKCPDGNQSCSFGKEYCKETDGNFECAALSEEEQLSKRLVAGGLSILTEDMFPDEDAEPGNSTCTGTICSNSSCCPDLKSAVCCEGVKYCCPSSTKCCGGNGTSSWCCAAKTKCHEKVGYCKAGASTLSSAAICLLLIFLLTTTKYFI